MTGGIVYFRGGFTGYFWYEGVGDTCLPLVYLTVEDMCCQEAMHRVRARLFKDGIEPFGVKWISEWSSEVDSPDHPCVVCAKQDEEEVILYSSYGYGSAWYGRASRSRLLLTSHYEDEERLYVFQHDGADFDSMKEGVPDELIRRWRSGEQLPIIERW